VAPVAGTQGTEPTYVVWKTEAIGSGLWAVYVQVPDGSNLRMVVPGVGLSLTRVTVAADVVAQLWEQKRGATPLAEG
jgi:hypothetical protein